MNKFDTETTTRKFLTTNKKPDCVIALTELFDSARKEGLGLREAYWYAETVHFLRDHDGHNNGPEVTFEETDEAARQIIIDTMMAKNDDGRAEDRIDIIIGWYERLRSWGAGVAFAFATATRAGQEEWESANDMPESEAVAAINQIGSTPETQEIKGLLLKYFYNERRAGNSVTASLRAARDEAEEWLVLAHLFAGTGISTRGRSYLDNKGGGLVN